jgi:serine/threonine protein kinase
VSEEEIIKLKKVVERQYQIESEVGRGEFGIVFKVKKNEIFALKVIKVEKKDLFAFRQVVLLICSISRAKIWLEFNTQQNICSENVVRVIKRFVDNDFLFIEMEYMDNGSLFDLIRCHLKKNQFLSFRNIWIVFLQLLKGIDGVRFY